MPKETHKIDIERLKQVTPIMDLAKSLGLEIRGRQAICFNNQAHAHGDRNFSLGLDIHRNRFRCFACGKSGSVIDLYMAVKCIDYGFKLKRAG